MVDAEEGAKPTGEKKLLRNFFFFSDFVPVYEQFLSVFFPSRNDLSSVSRLPYSEMESFDRSNELFPVDARGCNVRER